MEKGNNRKDAVWEAFMIVATAGASAAAVLFYGGGLAEMLRMLLVSAMACGSTVFAMENEWQRID